METAKKHKSHMRGKTKCLPFGKFKERQQKKENDKWLKEKEKEGKERGRLFKEEYIDDNDGFTNRPRIILKEK